MSCNAQTVHNDKLEYGYQGRVKEVIKRSFANTVRVGSKISPDSNSVTTNVYFFNEQGNMDSTTTERLIPSGDIYFYQIVYKFEKNRKVGWTASNSNYDRMAYATITWNSNKDYTEKVYDTEGNLKYETKSILNDSFRMKQTNIKAYDESGNLIQDDVQEFRFGKLQQVEQRKIVNQSSGTIATSTYEYLAEDSRSNPTKILILNGTVGNNTLVTIEYSYYD